MSKPTARQIQILHDILTDLRGLHPYMLARHAFVHKDPDSEDSCGATFLINVRIRVVEAVWGYLTGVNLLTGGDWSTHLSSHDAASNLDWLSESEQIQKIVDDAIPFDSQVCWLIFTDLSAWEEEFSWATEWSEREDMTPLCKAAISRIAHRLAANLTKEVVRDLRWRGFAEAGKDEVEV